MSGAFAVATSVLDPAPAHWRKIPLWTVLKRRDEIGVPGQPLLSVYRDHGVVPKDSRDDNFNRSSDDLGRYRYVRPGDLVLNKMKTWQGALAVSDYEGIVSPAYLVCGLAPGVHPRFVHHLLRSEPYVHLYRTLSQGIRPNQWDLAYQDFRSLPMLCPPLDEQRRIAGFLDVATARIDRIMTARSRHSALLESRFRQIADGAVTGDKTSLDSLGCRIPTGEWAPVKIGRICRILPGYAFPSENFVSAGTPLLRGANVGVGAITWDDVVHWDERSHPVPQQFQVRAGDLVMGMDRPWISGGLRIAVVQRSDLPALLLQRVACLRGKGGVRMPYLRRVLASSWFRTSLEHELTGVSVPHLSGEQIEAFRFGLPPLPVQELIAAGLDRQERLVAGFRERAGRQCELLSERRRALVTAAVTGRLDITTARDDQTTESAVSASADTG